MRPWEIQAAEVLGLAAGVGLIGGALIAWILQRWR